MHELICNNCNCLFSVYDKRRKYCSRKCSDISCSKKKTGVPFSKERKANISLSKSRKPSENELLIFKELVALGMPKGYLINYFNGWPRLINNWLEWYFPNKSYNLMKCLENKITHEQVKEVIKLTNDKMRHRRIAEKLNISKKTVLKILRFHSKINPNIKIYSYDSEIHTKNRSKLEIEIGFLLEKNNIKLIEQFLINDEKFNYDYRVHNTNILIEVNGDYYHCNPNVYQKPQNKYHIWVKAKDKAKKLYAEKHGYKVLYIWELDFKTNKEDAILKLIKEIENAKN